MQLGTNERALSPLGILKEGVVENINAIGFENLVHNFKDGQAAVGWNLISISETAATPFIPADENQPGAPAVDAAEVRSIVASGLMDIPADIVAAWNGNNDVIFNYVAGKINVRLAV